MLSALSIDGIALDVDRDLYAKLLRGWIDLVGFDSSARRRTAPKLKRRGWQAFRRGMAPCQCDDRKPYGTSLDRLTRERRLGMRRFSEHERPNIRGLFAGSHD